MKQLEPQVFEVQFIWSFTLKFTLFTQCFNLLGRIHNSMLMPLGDNGSVVSRSLWGQDFPYLLEPCRYNMQQTTPKYHFMQYSYHRIFFLIFRDKTPLVIMIMITCSTCGIRFSNVIMTYGEVLVQKLLICFRAVKCASSGPSGGFCCFFVYLVIANREYSDFEEMIHMLPTHSCTL